MSQKKLKKLIINGEAYNLPNNSDFVDLSSNQSVWGTKTFTSEPVIPSKSSDATNSWTAIASEAQVYKKQDKLTLPNSPTSWHLVTWWANNNTLADWGEIPAWVPSWWTAWQILTKKSSWYDWEDAPQTYSEISKNDLDTWTWTTAWVLAAKTIADYVSWRIGSAVNYKWQVADYASLPANPNTWDMYNVVAAHTTAPKFDAWTNVVWSGSAWDPLAEMVDLSNLVDKTTAQTISWVKTFTAEPVLPSKSSDATNDWTKPATEAQVYKKLDSWDLWNATITFKQWISDTAIWTLTTNQSSAWTIKIHDNVPITQDDYDDLPSTKATDWNSYWIYETVS